MNYFMLECYARNDEATITRYPDLPSPMDNWMLGRRWTTPMLDSLIFEIDEDDQGVLRPMMKTHFLLMTESLVAALQSAGVDNIDSYPAVVRETATGVVHKNYMAVNVIGNVSAIDESTSKTSSIPDLDLPIKIYDEIALDEAKCRGHLLFRLAEKPSALVVHASVKKALLAKGFDRLEFIEPKNWAG